MAKFHGVVGYGDRIKTAPGVFEVKITERIYSGDLTRNTRRLQSSENVNDDITVSNEVSIIADPYASQNFHKIVYVIFMGTKWKVTNAEVLYPRINLTVGGVYNG